MLGVVVAVVAALLVIGAVITYRMARSNDTVESFRRQIDALSPEARRGTVDQVNRIDDSSTDSAIEGTSSDSTSIDNPATEHPAIDDSSAVEPDAPDAQSAGPPNADTAGQPDDEHGS